jgi:hypothetical protein
LQWLETGGIKTTEQPYTESMQYFSAQDIKFFNHGNGIFVVEPGSVSDNNDEEFVYDKDDYEDDEPESLYTSTSDLPEPSPPAELPHVSPQQSDESPEDIPTPVISRKGHKRSRTHNNSEADNSQVNEELAAKPITVIE